MYTDCEESNIAWAPLWGKKLKKGSNRKNIGERSESSGSLFHNPNYASLFVMELEKYLVSHRTI